MATKLILDTDIGTDVDDAWALALCLASSEVELVGVTLVYGDLDIRAKIALKLLHLAGRVDVPVYKGMFQPLTDGAGVYWAGHEGSETDFSDIKGLHARDGGVDFILETVAGNPGEVVVCSIGPLSNIAEAIRRSPETMRQVKKLVIMASSYEGEGPEASEREHNSASDPVATKLVIESQISSLIVGLNVTTKVTVDHHQVDMLSHTSFGRYLSAMTHQYFQAMGRDFTYMHDPLAVVGAIWPHILTTQRMRADVFGAGCVAYYADADGWLDVCVDVDVRSFEEMLVERVRHLPETDNA